MCGIVGILNLNQKPVSHSRIKAMTDSLVHRGPDGEGQYVDGHVGLGHRRLSIIDLTSAGHQPMQTEDGRYTITYNGELYNFKELRVQLEALGHTFHSNTDTEVVLKAYAQWQHKCLDKFNGMFAFVVWDKVCQTLFLARDRYGIKPLYYYKGANVFIFASEIKAILASSCYKSELNKEGLLEYLTFQNFFTNKTLYKGIHLLMPGMYATVANGAMQSRQYWDFDFSSSMALTETQAKEQLDYLFTQAVQRQLISDVPVNAYLSGGIDSGAITMIASQFIPHMQTFTIGFDLSSASGLELSFDERVKAEHISYLAKTEHYEMVLKAGDMERCLPNYSYHLEEPRVGQSYPNYYAAKLASKFGKVVLSGCGGDELFGGYPWRYFYSDKTIKFDKFIDQYYTKWQRLLPNQALKKLLSPIWHEIKQVSTRDIFAEVFKRIRKETLSPQECINYSLYLEAKTFLHGLLVVEDKLSMAHGLETRVPFLDNELVDFGVKLSTALKIKQYHGRADENDLLSKRHANQHGKFILRKTLEKYLDESITHDKKQGFSSPDASWFRGESIEYVKREFSCFPGIFNQESVNAILAEHVSGKKNNRLAIWSLLYLKKLLEKLIKPGEVLFEHEVVASNLGCNLGEMHSLD